MKLRRLLATAFLIATVAPANAAGDLASANDPEAVQRLTDVTGAGGQLRLHRATGAARFVRLPAGAVALQGDTPADRVADFLQRHGRAFGVKDPHAELTAPKIEIDRYGRARLTYRQVHRAVPVYAGVLRAHFDAEGRLDVVNGTFVPDISVGVVPVLQSDRAEELAREHVRRELELDPGTLLEARSQGLLVFRAGLVRRVAGLDHLVFEIEVGNGSTVRELVYVDAHDGRVVERVTGIHTALSRRIHEPEFEGAVIWNEGNALPYSTGDTTNDDQVNGLIDEAATVYDLFSNLSGGGFLSWDGQDAIMHSIWNATWFTCPNASWNGIATSYCDGVASDDVVAHEWGHGYTESTHGLIYQSQPGALNESYSDIFGEVTDQLNGAGTDTPANPRVQGDCSTFGGSLPPGLTVHSPMLIAGDYVAAGAGFNPAGATVSGDVELVNDGSDTVTDACQALVGFTPGRIALVDRGTCSFVSKARRVQDAGAIGMILVNSGSSVFSMGGSDPTITIHSVMISDQDGATIENQLGGGVNATIDIQDASADSVLWLMGEDAFGVGGAIRDMWNPVCFGDPGKLSDPQYWCAPTDAGGVHINSGIPNHAFSLLVDGGSYNGQTVAAIGLTRAVHLYWRAMTVYQVPDSDFADHADALTQSCTDLTGATLTDPSTGSPSADVIDAGDCAEVSRAMLAVEMSDVPPCTFTPLLDPNAPAPTCGTATFFDDLETDPTASWSFSNAGVHAEYIPRDWEWTSSPPGGGSGSTLFAASPDGLGDCMVGHGDQSGQMIADSPSIVLGGDPSLIFDHYVATEYRGDGGNMKISVNGGAFQPIDSADFQFNAYNGTLSDTGDNPLANEDAFTGVDGGTVVGSWGQSQVSLAAYAGTGDTIQLRFDFGLDGCGGIDGWYVDNVLVCSTGFTAGRVPDGNVLPGTQLTVFREFTGELTLNWAESCHVADTDYAIYEGTLGSFTTHAPKQCSTGGTTFTVTPAAGSTYYLVVPTNGDREGSYGSDSDGLPRPQAVGPCLQQALFPGCT